jgi:CubicO group peptidase (beta-lactamase class C family)
MTEDHAAAAVQLKRRHLLVAGFAMLALPASSHGNVDRSTRARLDAFIVDEMRKAKIPGMGVGFAKNGVVHMARGFGLADIARHRLVTANTMFPIASITKTITATAVMCLVEKGKMKLDDPIGAHLNFPIVNPNYPDVPITFRHLLMHVSSISDAKYYEIDFRQPGRDVDTPLVDHLRNYLLPSGKHYSATGCFSNAAPGASWGYSNTGYALLGHLIDQIGGEDGRAQIAKKIFAPLGLRHTSWRIRDTPVSLRATPYDVVNAALTPIAPIGAPDWPAGMMRSSITDLMRFVAASANGGESNGVRIIGESSLAEMTQTQTPAGLPDWSIGQGLGWMASNLDGAIRLNHWGGSNGIFTAAYIDPTNRSGVAILTNATATAESKAVVKKIASRLLSS